MRTQGCICPDRPPTLCNLLKRRIYQQDEGINLPSAVEGDFWGDVSESGVCWVSKHSNQISKHLRLGANQAPLVQMFSLCETPFCALMMEVLSSFHVILQASSETPGHHVVLAVYWDGKSPRRSTLVTLCSSGRTKSPFSPGRAALHPQMPSLRADVVTINSEGFGSSPPDMTQVRVVRSTETQHRCEMKQFSGANR